MSTQRVFRNRKEAEKAGFSSFSKGFNEEWRKGEGKNHERAIVRSPLEARLAEALEEAEQGGPRCPCCGRDARPGRDPKHRHAEDCKLSLALRAFRGES